MCRFFWLLLLSAIMTATPSIGAASSIPYPGSSPYILPERLAFVIGIDNYRYGNIGLLRLKQLEQASEDARRMEEALPAFGFKVEKKRGWFGREEHTYQDALGNQYTKKKGLFGRTKTESSFFGSKVSRKGNDTEVIGPNGKPMITTKKRLFRGKETHVDGNSIWENIKSVF